MKHKIILALLLCLFQGCHYLSSQPDVSVYKSFDRKDIAVMDFAVKGSHITQAQGKYAADRLSDKLFLSDSCTVVDRSRVREAQKLLGISGSTPMSADQIQKAGLRLKAKYLVLGDIIHVMPDDLFDLEASGSLQISFRIIGVMNGDVLGIATYKMDDSAAGFESIIDKMLDKMVGKVIEVEN